jgi:hypothetical protein
VLVVNSTSADKSLQFFLTGDVQSGPSLDPKDASKEGSAKEGGRTPGSEMQRQACCKKQIQGEKSPLKSLCRKSYAASLEDRLIQIAARTKPVTTS